jgi:hypothetical protein
VILRESQHSEKVGVWYAITGQRIIRPNFFIGTVDTTANLHVFSHSVEQLDDVERTECYFR